MSAPDPESRPPGESPPEEELPLVMPTSSDRVRMVEEERRQLRHRLELQRMVYQFSSQMRSQRKIDSIARILADAVAELTSFRNAFITVFEEDGKTLKGVVGSGHRRTFEIGLRLSKYQLTRIHVDVNDIPQYVQAMETGEIYYHRTKEDIVKTLAALSGLNPGILEIIRRTTRMNLALTVPLFIGEAGPGCVPLGFIAISSIKNTVDEEEVQVVRILADQASLAIYNALLFDRVRSQVNRARSSEARFRRIMDTAHDMIISYAPDGTLNFANNAIRESNLYSMEGELIDKETLDKVHPDDQARLVEAYLGLHDNIPIRGIEYRIRTTSGEWLHHNLNAALVPDTNGDVKEMVAFIRDVTMEHRREKQIIRRNKELEVLNALITNLTSDIDYEEMVARSLNIITEFTGADLASFISVKEPVDGQLNVVGHLWVPKDFQEFMKKNFPKPPETLLFTGNEVQVVTDLTLIPDEYRHYVDNMGIKTIVSVPVMLRGEVIGYVIGGVKGPLILDEEDIAILRAVGDQMGLVFEAARIMKDADSA
jgi:PAS domain S-box-containing protein